MKEKATNVRNNFNNEKRYGKKAWSLKGDLINKVLKQYDIKNSQDFNGVCIGRLMKNAISIFMHLRPS